MHAIRIVFVALQALIPAAASAQCGDWEPVPSPDPTGVNDFFTAAAGGDSPLHALLLADGSPSFGNQLTPHVLRREQGGWTDLGGPNVAGLSGPVDYRAMSAANGTVLLGGVSGDSLAYQDEPFVARHESGEWATPTTVSMINQVLYPFHDRGGEIYAFDTAPDGTEFAVGLAKGYGLTGDTTIPLFLKNSGSGWFEMTRPDTDWPGGFSSETYLTDVIAFARDDVWAVGWHASEEGVHPTGGLIVHWDGEALEIVVDPLTDDTFHGHPFQAMAASGPDDIWAVGGSIFEPATSTIARFDGDAWTRVESPLTRQLRSLTINGDGTIWAAPGFSDDGMAYFDGASWTRADLPRADAAVLALAQGADGAVWALGGSSDSTTAHVIVCGCAADLTGDGVLDLADVQAFATGFQSGAGASDLADPRGVLDLADVQAFIDSFVSGCG